MPNPILSESLGPDLDPVPGYSHTSAGLGRSNRPPFPLRSVPPVPCRGGTGLVRSVWP